MGGQKILDLDKKRYFLWIYKPENPIFLRSTRAALSQDRYAQSCDVHPGTMTSGLTYSLVFSVNLASLSMQTVLSSICMNY